jgi:hypothetical protein
VHQCVIGMQSARYFACRRWFRWPSARMLSSSFVSYSSRRARETCSFVQPAVSFHHRYSLACVRRRSDPGRIRVKTRELLEASAWPTLLVTHNLHADAHIQCRPEFHYLGSANAIVAPRQPVYIALLIPISYAVGTIFHLGNP